MSDPESHKQHFARPTAAPCLESLVRLLARQAAAEAWAGSVSGGARDADSEADVADQHEQ